MLWFHLKQKLAKQEEEESSTYPTKIKTFKQGMKLKLEKLNPNLAQTEALKSFESWKENKGVVVLPTGAGKTILSAMISKNFSGKILFVAHRQEILEQSKKSFKKVFGKVLTSFYNADKKNIGKITFASVQTLTKSLNKFDKRFFDLIIVDEVHHYQAKSYKKVVEYFEPKFLLGLTATPFRTDNQDIFDLCGKPFYEMTIQQGIQKGLLCKFDYYCVDNDIDFSNIFWNGQRYDAEDLNRKLCIPEYDKAIFEEWQKSANDKKTIVFCATVEHSKRLEKVFNSKGIKACSLDGKMNKAWRSITINKFRKSDYKIIFVRDLFNEGVDIPDTECVMFLRPTESSIIFTQQLGRGLRINEGKKLLVLDFTGNSKRAGLNIEVLGKVLGKDIVQQVKDSKKNNLQEFVVKELGCTVKLNKYKIELIKENLEITKEDCVDEARKIMNVISKKTITQREFIIYSKFGIRFIKRHFGTWNKFLEYMNVSLNKNYNISKQDCVDEARKIMNIIGKKTITQREFCKHLKFSEHIIKRLFGSWNNFLKYMNITLNPILIQKEFCIEEYKRIKKITNKRIITSKDFRKLGKIGLGPIKRLFGSWNNFLKYYNLPIYSLKSFTKEDCVEEYKRIKKITNKNVITMKDFKNYAITYQLTIKRLFGSWNNFLKYMNIPINQITKPNKQYFIKEYEKVKKITNKRIITSKDFNKFSSSACTTIKRHFGTWNKFLEYMNNPINLKINNTKQDCVDIYNKVLILTNKEKINSREFLKFGTISMHPIKRLFGSWQRFLEYINNLPIKVIELSESNLVLVNNYVPKNQVNKELINKEIFESKVLVKKSFKDIKKIAKQYNFGEKKDELRTKILKKIRNGDTVLLLESPKLYAVKEMIELGLKPKKVLIPNNQEFKVLAESFKEIEQELPFRVEVINTSALQLIADLEEKIDFAWLDYYGAFVNYSQDLALLFDRGILNKNARVLGTYRILDFKAKNESHYFANAIDFIIQKSQDLNQKIKILSDVSCRYKSTMYNVGIEFV